MSHPLESIIGYTFKNPELLETALTIHFFKDILADNTYAENREDSAFIWDNYYDVRR